MASDSRDNGGPVKILIAGSLGGALEAELAARSDLEVFDPHTNGNGHSATPAAGDEPAPQAAPAPGPGQRALFNAWEDAVECAKCGGRKVRTGACYTCRDCGDNSGCG